MTRPVFLDSRKNLLASLLDFRWLESQPARDLEAAVAEYRFARSAPTSWMLGSFVVHASALIDLASLLVRTMRHGEAPWNISVVLRQDDPAGAATAAAFAAELAPAARVVAAELHLPPRTGGEQNALRWTDNPDAGLNAAVSISADLVAYLELAPADDTPRSALAAVAAASARRTGKRHQVGLMLRCDVDAPATIPGPGTLAALIVGCRDQGIVFKPTGLDGPVHRLDEVSGAHRHGLLNFLVACAIAEAGAEESVVAAIVAERDPSALRAGSAGVSWRGERAAPSAISAMRARRVASVGTENFSQSVGQLETARWIDASRHRGQAG